MRRLLPLLFLLGSACTVPTLEELGPKACDPEEGHPCPEGSACVAGTCRSPEGGPCSVEGETRPCGSDVGECAPGTQACTGGTWTACVGEVGPLAEVCDGKDNDCDGEEDEGEVPGAPRFFRDADGDGHGNPAEWVEACSAPAGYLAVAGDCDDGDEAVNPGAQEACDGKDTDCDGEVDNPPVQTMPRWYPDGDGDGYGAEGSAGVPACAAPPDHVATADDCDDAAPGAHPGAPEVCNGADDDCDGEVDEGVKLTFYADQDGDGHGDPDQAVEACAAPAGHVPAGDDCDDGRADVHPGAVERCDGLDNDCDGTQDEAFELAVATSAGAPTTSLAWAAAGAGISAVYVDAQRVWFRRFGPALQPVGAAVELSDPLALKSLAPAIAALGDDVFVAWVSELQPGTQQIVLARIDPQGQPQLTAPGGRVVVSSSAQPVGGPRVAVNSSTGRILVAWIHAPDQSTRAAVFDADGTVHTAAQTVSAGAGPGAVVAIDAAAVPGSGRFIVGTGEAVPGGGRARFRELDPSLALIGEGQFSAGSPPTDVTVLSDSAAAWGAWVDPAAAGYFIVTAPEPHLGGAASPFLGPLATELGSLRGALGPAGPPVWAWVRGLAPSEVEVSSAAGTALPVTGGGPLAFAPAVTFSPGTGGFLVGYEQDRGASLDLFALHLCLPGAAP